jgi:hypothetical protein
MSRPRCQDLLACGILISVWVVLMGQVILKSSLHKSPFARLNEFRGASAVSDVCEADPRKSL